MRDKAPNLDDWIEINNLNEDAIVFEPHEVYGRAIAGLIEVEDGTCVLCYSYDDMIESLAESYMQGDEKMDEDEAYTSAMEWVDYNTVRSLDYMSDPLKPIILYPVED